MITSPLLVIPIFIRLGLYRAVTRFTEDRVDYVVAGRVTLSVLLLAAITALTHTQGLSRGMGKVTRYGAPWLYRGGTMRRLIEIF